MKTGAETSWVRPVRRPRTGYLAVVVIGVSAVVLAVEDTRFVNRANRRVHLF
jgi:hypothetical protein